MKAILFGILLLFAAAPCFSAELKSPETIKTRYGTVRVTHDDIGRPDGLEFSGKEIFISQGQHVSMHGYVGNKTSDVVLFGVNCGGSSCAPDELHLLVLRKNSKPVIISDTGVQSADATMLLHLKNGVVEVDLGFEDGHRKFAVLTGDAVKIRFGPTNIFSLKEEDCRWIYEESSSSCAQVGESRLPCTSADDTSLSVGAMNGLKALSNHPGYNASEWNKNCVSWCKGATIGYGDFKRAVCSIKAL